MTENEDMQINLFGADTPFTKMCQEHYQATKEKTGKPSSQKQSALLRKRLPTIQCLKTGNGLKQAGSLEWVTMDNPFPWLGESMTLNIGECHNEGKEYAYWLTSPVLQHLGFCLTLNLSERPRKESHSELSEILVDNADEKFYLSAMACQGILNRAERRGKVLPETLKKTLESQAKRDSK